MRRLLVSFIIVIASVGSLYAQVAISPTTVFIGNTNFGSFLVMNNSSQAQEIAVEFIFGYTVSDSLGNVSMNFTEQGNVAASKSINDHIRSFPRAFVLQPGQRQTVRLTVRPPAGLADGTYWTRVKVRSNPQTTVITASEAGGVGTQINFIFEQVIGAYYKRGTLSTGIQVDNVQMLNQEQNQLLIYDYSLQGNSPFLGVIRLAVKDRSGNVVYSDAVTTSLLVSGRRNFAIPASAVPPGQYSATITFDTNRGDIASGDRIQMETVEQTFQIRF